MKQTKQPSQRLNRQSIPGDSEGPLQTLISQFQRQSQQMASAVQAVVALGGVCLAALLAERSGVVTSLAQAVEGTVSLPAIYPDILKLVTGGVVLLTLLKAGAAITRTAHLRSLLGFQLTIQVIQEIRALRRSMEITAEASPSRRSAPQTPAEESYFSMEEPQKPKRVPEEDEDVWNI